MNDNVKDLPDRVKKLETDLKSREEMRERLEAQPRRENLRFHGIPKDRDEPREETKEKIKDYISRDLDMNQASTSIERAHRMQSVETPRPAIIKDSFYQDKERVLKTH